MSLIENKKLHLNYEIKERFEAGLELFGNEVKAIRNSKAEIDGAKIIIRGGEAFIVGMNVSPYQSSEKALPNSSLKERTLNPSLGEVQGWAKNDRTRKLLLKKSEILKLSSESEKGGQIFPIKIYDKHGLLKMEICLAKRKNKKDKRETLKLKEFKKDRREFI